MAFSSSAQKLLPCFVWHIFLREENVFWLSIFSAFWKQNVDQAVEGGREGRAIPRFATGVTYIGTDTKTVDTTLILPSINKLGTHAEVVVV